MPVPDWPTDIPCTLQIDGQAGGIGDGRIRSASDTGPAKVRRRTTAQVEPIVGNMIMNATEIASLRTFVDTTLFGGTRCFYFKDPITHTPTLMRFGDQLPSWSPMPGKKRWLVQLTLEKVP